MSGGRIAQPKERGEFMRARNAFGNSFWRNLTMKFSRGASTHHLFSRAEIITMSQNAKKLLFRLSTFLTHRMCVCVCGSVWNISLALNFFHRSHFTHIYRFLGELKAETIHSSHLWRLSQRRSDEWKRENFLFPSCVCVFFCASVSVKLVDICIEQKLIISCKSANVPHSSPDA